MPPFDRRKAALTTCIMMAVLPAASRVFAKPQPLAKDHVKVSTEYGDVVLDRISLTQHDKYVTVSGTVANTARTGWNVLVLALTFFGKDGDVLPPEPDASTFVRIRNLRQGEVKSFSEQIPWHIIHRKFHLPEGRIVDFVAAFDNDDSRPGNPYDSSSHP
jgi:hypothetical protein